MKKHSLTGSDFHVKKRHGIHYLVLAVLFFGFYASVQAQEMRKIKGITTICPAKFEDMHTKHGVADEGPLFLQRNILKTPTAVFETTFGPGALADPEVQAAFQFALDIWATEIVSSVPIRVFVDFASLGNGVLAQAGPTHQLINFPGAPEQDVAYPAALANSLAGEILDPTEQFDLTVSLGNSIPFYLGTDGNTPAGQFDFITIALHEAGHGLGFTTNRGYDAATGSGSLRNGGIPAIYSLFIVDGDRNRLLDFEDPSVAIGDAFTGGDIFVDGPFATAALGGTIPEIYAPAAFAGGSSIAHWDEGAFPAGDPNSLMTPQVGQAESNFDIGAITRGHFKDMGWILNDADAPQIVLSPKTFSETMDVDTVLAKELTISSIADTDLLVTISTPNTDLISFPGETSFALASTESTSVAVEFSTTGITKGIYEAEIVLTVEGDENTLSVPVTLRVIDGTEVPIISVSPDAFSETIEQLSFVTRDLIIDNTGDENLNYSISIDGDEPTTTFAERVAISTNAINTNGFQKLKTTISEASKIGNAPIFEVKNAIRENVITSLYATSFEEFAPGDINGQLGWVGQFPDNWTIATENAFEGTQHLRAVSDGLGSTRDALILALSPIFETTGDEPFTVFDAKVNIQGGGVTWEVIPATANPQTLATRLRFKPDGTIETLVGASFVPVPAVTPTGYFDLKITVDRDDASFAIYFDDKLVFTGQGGAVAIEQVILLSNMEVEGPIFDMDNFELTNGDADAGFVTVTPAIGTVPFLTTSTATVKLDARSLDPGSYEATITVSSDDTTNSSIDIPVNLTVLAPPTLVVNPDAISAAVDVTVDDPAITTATFTVSNTGESTLEFEGALGEIAFTPSVNAANATPLQNLDLAQYGLGQKGVFSEKLSGNANRLAIAKNTKQLENTTAFADSIFYDSGIAFPDNFAGLDTQAYTSAVRFESPSNFTLTALRNGYRSETVTDPTVILEIYRGGATPDQGELLLTQTFTQTVVEGSVSTEVLNEALPFATGEVFWVVHKYPLGIQFPQGVDDAATQRPNTYFFSGDSGATYSPSGFVFFVRALSGGGSSTYLTLEPAAATLAPGASIDVVATFDGTTLANGTYTTPILLNSNDPVNPEVSVATTFTVSGQQSFLETEEALVLFDNVFIGNEKEASIRLTNSGLATINITSITSDNGVFVIDDFPTVLEARESSLVPITFIPNSIGNSNGIITIESDADNAATVEVVVNGVGVAPPIALLTPDMTTAEVTIKGTTTSNVVLRNVGDAPLVYSFPEFAAAQALAAPNVQLNNTAYIDFGNISKDKNVLDTRIGSEVFQSVGRDLTFGYTWIDSDEVGGPVYNYQDISATGTDIAAILGGEGVEEVALSFPFTFYGTIHESLLISANGFVSFQAPFVLSFFNDQIPSNLDFTDNLIAGFWDDLEPQLGNGAVYYQSFDDRFVVQYSDVRAFGKDEAETVTFQIVLYADGAIEIFYEDVENATFNNEGTVGIENADGTDGAQVAFNTEYVKDGLAVRFIQPEVAGVDFITNVSSLSGVVPVGGSRDLTVTLSAGNLLPGVYMDELVVSSNSPDKSDSSSIIELTVIDTPEILSIDLIDATTDEIIAPLTEGSVIDLADYDENAFNFVANTGTFEPGSVVFDFNTINSYRIENKAPFALGGNFGTDFLVLPLVVGPNTITATPYEGVSGSGIEGIPLTINFTVIDSSLPIVSELVLVNADTDEIIGTLADGDVINTTDLGTVNFNVIAVTGLEPVGSVTFGLNDVANYRTERNAPFALEGNIGDDYRPIQFPFGENTITATPFTATPKEAGTSISVTFTVIEVPVVNTFEIESIAPNPVNTVANFVVKNPKGGQVEAYLLNLLGNTILTPSDFTIDTDGNGQVDMTRIQQGTYLLMIQNEFGETAQAQIIK